MPYDQLRQARFGILTTVRPDGRPHAVPIVFALVGDQLVTAVDQKPKSTRALTRLENIRNNPAVSVIVHHDDEDWTQLSWVRVDGTGKTTDHPEPAWTDALVQKYPQYRDDPPIGPWIIVTIDRIASWSHS
jgi:PPOX class probable F420-dependent enzyme